MHGKVAAQREKLSRAAKSVNRECGLIAPIGVGSGDLGGNIVMAHQQ